jgi:hypothetical protein
MDQFGSGIVVPLVLFTEHLNNPWALRIEDAITWKNLTPTERLPIIEANKLGETRWSVLLYRVDREDIEDIISDLIGIWGYGAGDHLLNIDKKKAPKSLVELAKLVIAIRFGKIIEPMGEDVWHRIKILWRETAMDIDEQIVKTNPQWEAEGEDEE